MCVSKLSCRLPHATGAFWTFLRMVSQESVSKMKMIGGIRMCLWKDIFHCFLEEMPCLISSSENFLASSIGRLLRSAETVATRTIHWSMTSQRNVPSPWGLIVRLHYLLCCLNTKKLMHNTKTFIANIAWSFLEGQCWRCIAKEVWNIQRLALWWYHWPFTCREGGILLH